MSWDTFRLGVEQSLGAPDGANNQAILLAWAHQESGADVMRWQNPWNTTQKEPGSVNSGAQPGPDDVQIYPDEATGVRASLATLQNGRYSSIVYHIQNDSPPSAWRADPAIASEFQTWGTGAGFLANIPDPTGDDVSEQDVLNALNTGTGTGQQDWASTNRTILSTVQNLANEVAQLLADVQALQAAVAALPPGSGPSAALSVSLTGTATPQSPPASP